MGLFKKLVILVGALLVLGPAWACSGETGADEPAADQDQPARNARQDRAPASGLLAFEESDRGLGERVGLGGLTLRIFGVRDEDVIYYTPGPGERAVSRDSSDGQYVAVDFVVSNDSGSPVRVRPEALMGDTAGAYHRPGQPLETVELRPGQSRASTLFFDVPNGIEPERLGIRLAGEEASLDLLSDRRDGIPPEDYLRVYHLYFKQRAYEEAYEMYDPASTQGVTLGDWLSFFEPLWGNRYLMLDSLERVFVGPEEASFEMDRTFYARDGEPVDDPVLNAPVLQEMVRAEGAWQLVMGDDLVADIVAEVPQFEPPPEEPPPGSEEQESTAPETTAPEPAPETTAPGITAPEATVGWAASASPAGGYACTDFRTQEEAQLYLTPDIAYSLDADGNGLACEMLP